MRPHRRQPTRLPHPWDSPGKNTGVGCHFLLQCIKVKSERESLSRVRLFATPWTAAHQAPLSMGFSRQECWSGVPLPSPTYSEYPLKNVSLKSTCTAFLSLPHQSVNPTLLTTGVKTKSVSRHCLMLPMGKTSPNSPFIKHCKIGKCNSD